MLLVLGKKKEKEEEEEPPPPTTTKDLIIILRERCDVLIVEAPKPIQAGNRQHSSMFVREEEKSFRDSFRKQQEQQFSVQPGSCPKETAR